ncbi:TfuA-like protein [Paractinoplanes lichenicola]|uniref:TfuA-like protein n=1 Tax=Paractinoplanes lichenicola TaxID=2802976 RepID=A0ABS1VMU0_9ACTN|nr:TfuA-like protein [Actinoplanes lichenicola]MBL7256030.1 TfuA-like protein [Actinoplanes lichenicola]
MTRLHVFAGPSRPAALGPAVEDAVVWHPPIRHGDLFRLRPDAGTDILIIDGLYQQHAPIRHKEIIAALRQGVRISGAASMGALRAVELGEYGMRGFGTVFQWYATGRLESDADVALTHGPAEEGYRPFTVTIVSILAATDWLCATGALSRSAGDRLVGLCQQAHFTARSRGLLRRLADDGGLRAEMDLLLDALNRAEPGDVKQHDAASAIRALVGGAPAGPAPDLRDLPASSYEAQWRLDFTPYDDVVTEGQLLTFAQLFLPDWPRRQLEHVRRIAAGADLWPAAPDDRRELPARFCTPDELRTLSGDELAARLLVRSFRLRPGRLVHLRLPVELFTEKELRMLASTCAKALRLDERAHETVASYSATQLSGEVVDDAFAAVWACPDFENEVLDRGFAGVDQFRRQARPFVAAARAMVGTRAVPVGSSRD